MGLLNFSNIFRDHKVTSEIAQHFENLDPSYYYQQKNLYIIFKYNQVNSDPDFRISVEPSCSRMASPFLYPLANHVVTCDSACSPDKNLRSIFKNGIKLMYTEFHPGLILLNAGVLSRKHFRLTVNDGLKRKASKYMTFTTWKWIFTTVGKKNLLHIHIYTNRHPVVQLRHWNYTVNMSLLLPTKQTIASLS